MIRLAARPRSIQIKEIPSQFAPPPTPTHSWPSEIEAQQNKHFTQRQLTITHTHIVTNLMYLFFNLIVTQRDYVGGLLCMHVLILKSDHHSLSCKGRKASQSVALHVLG